LLLFLQQYWFLADTYSDRLVETKKNIKVKKFWFSFCYNGYHLSFYWYACNRTKSCEINPTEAVADSQIKREEHTFIQSDVDNDDLYIISQLSLYRYFLECYVILLIM
jgi:hypothetical protein